MNTYHTGVLLQEGVNALRVQEGEKYIDATLGGGGHTREIIRLGGIVLALDVDSDAIKNAQLSLGEEIADGKLILVRGNFAKIDEFAKIHGFSNVLGILFDLGVSSHQLDTPSRGFSYLKSGPLDMRMDRDLSVSAADLINALGRKELYDLFNKFGEEHNSRTISERIISARSVKPFETTDELVGILAKAYGFNNINEFAKANSSKKVFQALRIAVNDELENLKTALLKSLDLLEPKGRIAVISFHSLEDRIVKHCFTECENEGKGSVITKKPIVPLASEVLQNPRSKGAKLRIFEVK